MKDSAERIQYITEYIVSYEAKIEALNKKGLFDTATLYEIFAQKICEIWFGQRFSNLNSAKANFPYVDLLSEDNELYVQVSTIQDVPAKVKSTLEKIRDSKSRELQGVNKLFFFVLSNDSVGNVKDFSGESRIGKIEFLKDENLITTDNIIQKAKTDIEFQIALYDFLQSESDTLMQIGEKFEEAVTISKALIDNNIDCFINDEYAIDRSNEIRQIQEDGENFISIQGEAGSGKSALCKMLLKEEEWALYARAEKISEARNMEDIWGLDIRKVIKYINQRKLVIYIDALEFIADGAKTKLDLLQQIYETVKEHSNIFVMTSCRTCDRTAFVKIETIYHIKKYDVSLLSDNQILEIAREYKIIQDLWEKKSYIQLLRSPFYVNLIINKIKDFKKIDDVDGFRNLIWTEVMCMSGKSLPDGISHSDIRKAIEKIVFDRAKNFLSGVKRESIGEEIVDILQSENVVTLCGNNSIRLKYDIFEDICFERFIDEQYDGCKSDYDVFFTNIECLGRCVYRRYQIWVENKLFSKGNREKFLHKLLETDRIPSIWKAQTIVGIVKSNFCNEFFEEYAYSIPGDLLWGFIRLTNNFAFETTILNLKYENVYSKLKPIGMGRPCLINLICKTGVYKDNIYENCIRKLCDDYSLTFTYNDVAVDSACVILEFYVEEKMQKSSQESHFHIAEDINLCLLPIYRMAKISHGWIRQFWTNRIQGYLNSDGRSNRIDEDILEYVLKNAVPALAQMLPKELCEIADAYWIKTPEYDKRDFYYSRSQWDSAEEFGLSRKSDSYQFEYRSIHENAFLNIIIQYNWIRALDWIIKLTNHAADSMKAMSPESVYDICVWESSPEDEKNYICNPNFWLAGIQEHRVHELISDAIFLFTKMAIREINSKNNDEKIVIRFAEYIKAEIIKKANNIMMLSVLAEIGRNCSKVIPGYSLFLASSIDLVMLDNQKIALLAPNPDRQLYEKLILMSVGIPELKSRYDVEIQENESIQDYVLKMQLQGADYKAKAENILDYLYSIIPNEGEDARLNLQIQKMDLRNASVSRIDEHTYALIPDIKGDAKKIVEENGRSRFNIERNALQKIISDCNLLIAEDKFDLQKCIDTIEKLQSLIENSDVPGQLQNMLIMTIACALSKKEISVEKRSELCGVWIEGIESIFNNDSFPFEIPLVNVLYKQIEFELEDEIKRKMKRQMFECLLYRGQHGIISEISLHLKKYLKQNERLAISMFNTILSISEDRMDCFKYNASKLNEIGEKCEYYPNEMRPPTWVKDYFAENNVEPYQSRHEEIIEKCLLQEVDIDLSAWNIENCDIQTLAYISNCGLNFENEAFKMVMEKIFPYMISIISKVKHYHEFFDTYAVGEIKTFVENSLIGNQNVSAILDMLFVLPDFTKMNSDAYEIYDDISKHLLAVYFDGHSNIEIRRQCEVIIKSSEAMITKIDDDKVRNRLYSMMFLTLGKFHICDWNELHTEYLYKDKMFLNTIWSKYGWLHFKNFLYVIDQMHINALLPEVLIPLNKSLYELKKNFQKCERIVNENEVIVNKIITKAFLDYTDAIKSDNELTVAFEEFLSMLVEFDTEEAAVILDEFRVH